MPYFVMLAQPGYRFAAARMMGLQPILLTLHAFNWPWTLLDWYAQPLLIDLFDLWCGVASAVTYVCFYMFVLDSADLHFYPIIVARRWWGGFVLLFLLCICVGIWKVFVTWSAKLNKTTAALE